MSEETEKQEGQKTVVAFIAGLLIGGLLVWVFSSTPEQEQQVGESSDTDVETVTERTSNTSNATLPANTNTAPAGNDKGGSQAVAAQPAPEPAKIIRDGAIAVDDQPAGPVVVLTAVTHPTAAGWIAVREMIDGMPGNILR